MQVHSLANPAINAIQAAYIRKVVDTVNDKADPSYAPTAYAQALQAHPDVVGIGGTDGDSGKGAAIAITEPMPSVSG